jgi:hypothetical protein
MLGALVLLACVDPIIGTWSMVPTEIDNSDYYAAVYGVLNVDLALQFSLDTGAYGFDQATLIEFEDHVRYEGTVTVSGDGHYEFVDPAYDDGPVLFGELNTTTGVLQLASDHSAEGADFTKE